jgi:lantibiotic biosynthesis protein
MSGSGPDGWEPVLTGRDGRRARAVALETTARLLDRAHVHNTLLASAALIDQARAPPRSWDGPGLSGAGATAALLCAQLDECEPDAGWDRHGHACVAVASGAAENAPLGLFDGIAGMGYAAQRLARGRDRYGKLLHSLDEIVVASVAARWTGDVARRGMPVREWDLISGITGVGVYLLDRRHSPLARPGLEQVLAALVSLAARTDGPPCWATPAEYLFGYLREHNPCGALNCGLAHGIVGPLALLSLAMDEGVEVEGQLETVRSLAGWVSAQARMGEWGPQWPAAIPLEGETASPARPGWCYGNAGVARALWLAGSAVDDANLRDLALRAVRQALNRQVAQRPLDAPTVCHGTAGLALAALRIAADSGAADIAQAARELCLALVHDHDARSGFGYRDVTAAGNGRRLEVDDPTLLAGAAGTALVLLAAATNVDPTWDRALLLA